MAVAIVLCEPQNRTGVVSCGLLDFLLCSVGDLNPILGFYFPLFSMVFPGEFPSGQKPVEVSGSKSVANCGQSTYKISMCFDDSLPFHGM